MKLLYKVDKKCNYANIKDLLRGYFNISERLLVKLKFAKRILYNNENTYLNHELNENDIIEVDLDFDEESDNIVPTKMDLKIVYEDDAMIIINKPSEMPVHPSQNHYEDSLSNGIKYYFNSIGLKRKIRPVNRLDRNTSGLVIFAKNEYIQECLIHEMKNDEFKKEYIAILEGFIENDEGIINAPIARKDDSIIEREVSNSNNAKEAITEYYVLDRFTVHDKELSLVKFVLKTGRTHQIRVHSKYIGHPILGDSLYGNKSDLISRHALHAYKIEFIHPISKEKLSFEIDLPEDFKIK